MKPVNHAHLNRQGGSGTDWDTVGENNYTPGNIRLQVGAVNVSSGAKTITFPEAFAAEPLVWLLPNAAADYFCTVSSVSTTQVTINIFDERGIAPTGPDPVFWMAIGPVV